MTTTVSAEPGTVVVDDHDLDNGLVDGWEDKFDKPRLVDRLVAALRPQGQRRYLIGLVAGVESLTHRPDGNVTYAFEPIGLDEVRGGDGAFSDDAQGAFRLTMTSEGGSREHQGWFMVADVVVYVGSRMATDITVEYAELTVVSDTATRYAGQSLGFVLTEPLVELMVRHQARLLVGMNLEQPAPQFEAWLEQVSEGR
jgi:hypothetical protein